jgi:hypothetical protein
LDDDLVDYIARRQGVGRDVALERLSEWLYLCFLTQVSHPLGRSRLASRPTEASKDATPR